MKKIKSILLSSALLILLAVSCSKDDPAPVTPAYVGSWLETNFTATGCDDPGDNEVHACTVGACETLVFTTTTLTIKRPGDPDEVLNFTASGSVLTVSAGGATLTATVTVVGTTLTLVTDGDAGCTNTNTYSKI